MMQKLLFFCIACLCFSSMDAATYQLTPAPIDVIIPSTDKDLATLEMCIEGIRANCDQVRRIIVISSRPLTSLAEWFDERDFPFTKQDIAYYLNGCDEEGAQAFLTHPQSRCGWYLQQMLKLYAPYVIPGLSSNILLLDSDTIFLNPVTFFDEEGNGLYNVGTEYHHPYFSHIDRMIPGLERIFPQYSGICHHLLLQKEVLDDLFMTVETIHGMPLWQTFCCQVDKVDLFFSGASEYEMYFNFAFSQTDQLHIRPLKWANLNTLTGIDSFKKAGYHYVSCHAWMR